MHYIRAKHNLILKVMMCGLCAVMLAWLHPSNPRQEHRLKGDELTWEHEDLVSALPLFIPKSADELNKEYRQMEREDLLCFYEDKESTAAGKERSASLLREWGAEALIPLADSLYESGIIKNSDLDQERPVLIEKEGRSVQAASNTLLTSGSAVAILRSRAASLKIPMEDASVQTIFVPNLVPDEKRTGELAAIRRQSVSLYSRVIAPGEVIVRRGDTLDVQKRKSLQTYYESVNVQTDMGWMKIMAAVLMHFICMMVLLVYLAFFRRNIFGQNRQVLFILLTVVAASLFCRLAGRYGLNLYLLPFCLVPMLVRVFFDNRTALFTFLITVLCTSFHFEDKLKFILLQLIAGIGTLFAVAEMRKRQQLVISAISVFLLYSIMSFCYDLIQGSQAAVFNARNYLPYVISSGLVLLAFPLIFITERIFGFVSDFKLLELADLNQPLLRRLSQDIPGTFQHSLQVANLAEEVIFYIGGNTLLVRAGAMYHDIGKLYDPKYFTENQMNGFSPHIEMQPLESARIIIGHVIKGIELAKQSGLPEQIIDFIRTHHGTTYAGYFLSLYKKERTVSEKEEQEFRYPGPIPFSKETAVLMLADAVEASSRSLKKHDAPSINELVDSIIDFKISQNQLINSDITFKDITLIKKVFKKRLMNIYHVRIEYPA